MGLAGDRLIEDAQYTYSVSTNEEDTLAASDHLPPADVDRREHKGQHRVRASDDTSRQQILVRIPVLEGEVGRGYQRWVERLIDFSCRYEDNRSYKES
jgi:hypothetical protein